MANKKIKGLQIQIGADYQGLDTAFREIGHTSNIAAAGVQALARAI